MRSAICLSVIDSARADSTAVAGTFNDAERALRRKTHDTIRRATIDIEERMHLNTAVSSQFGGAHNQNQVQQRGVGNLAIARRFGGDYNDNVASLRMSEVRFEGGKVVPVEGT